MFVEKCDRCGTEYIRRNAVTTVGLKKSGGVCERKRVRGHCRYVFNVIRTPLNVDIVIQHECCLSVSFTCTLESNILFQRDILCKVTVSTGMYHFERNLKN